jgi:sigma-B regulation protein RsbU (phosphoserine phosphatase)
MTGDERPIEDALILIVGPPGARTAADAALEAGGFDRRVSISTRDLSVGGGLPSIRPDAAIVDATEAGADGLALVRRLREDAGDLPILVQIGSLEERRAAFDAGASEVFARPVDIVELLARLTLLLDRARLARLSAAFREEMDVELRHAARMTRTILPQRGAIAAAAASAGVAIDAMHRPASRIGGDFWSVIPFGDGRLGLLVADVSGHGLSAALRAFGLHSLVQPPPPFAADPAAMIAHLDRRLFDIWGDTGVFTAAVYGVLDAGGGVFRSVGAGLRDGFVIRPDLTVATVAGRGQPLGLFEQAERRPAEVAVAPGDTLVLYSDAVVECFDVPGAPRDETEFAEWVADHLRNEPATDRAKLATSVGAEFVDAYGDGIKDDLLIVSVHRPAAASLTPG